MAEQDSENEDQERPLDPTPRRLERAREEGQFPQARDLTTLTVLGFFLIATLAVGGAILESTIEMTRLGMQFGNPEDWESRLRSWTTGPFFSIGGWLLALFIPVWIAAALTPLSLVRFQPKWVLKFRGSKLNVFKGLKRLISTQTLGELGKTILKVLLVFAVGVAYLTIVFDQLGGLPRGDTKGAIRSGLTLAASAVGLLVIPVVIIALVDVVLQLFNFRKRMRMTPEELKKELKETEGSPELKARLRQRQRQIATSRMMAALERADVVVTNPEHFAVALRYDMIEWLHRSSSPRALMKSRFESNR
jgi:flagellar biosynthetic protein FlhB